MQVEKACQGILNEQLNLQSIKAAKSLELSEAEQRIVEDFEAQFELQAEEK